MPKTILVVDDSPDLRTLISEVLCRAGYEVLQAARASAALGAIRARRVDLLVLDIEMPEMNGLTMLRHLREMGEAGAMPVILLTAQDERAMVSDALSLGICEYLLKSTFSLKELLMRVKQRLGPAEEAKGGAKPAGAASDAVVAGPG